MASSALASSAQHMGSASGQLCLLLRGSSAAQRAWCPAAKVGRSSPCICPLWRGGGRLQSPHNCIALILSVGSRAEAGLPGAARAVGHIPACNRTGSDCTISSTDEIDCQTTWQGRSAATWRSTSCSSRSRRCGPTSASRTTARSALAAASPSTPGSGRPARCALFYSTLHHSCQIHRSYGRSAPAVAPPSTPGLGRLAWCALFYSTFQFAISCRIHRTLGRIGAQMPCLRQCLVRAARQRVSCSCFACRCPSLSVVMHSGLR